jgi:ABC-type multidrug transport system fused ATPase/permease subunit
MKEEGARVSNTNDGIEVLDLSSPLPVKQVLNEDEENKKEVVGPLANVTDVFTAFGRTPKVLALRWCGVLCAMVSGSVYPIMAFYFSKSFEKLGAASDGADFLSDITDMVIVFIILGAVGFVFLVCQSACLEIAASESTADYKMQWFNALLRQDMAYYDIKDVSAQATVVSASAAKYKK